MPTVFHALSAVMADVQGVGKNQRNNTPGQNYMFRGIDAVTNAVGPALRKHGVIVVPEILTTEFGTVTVGKNRTEMGHVRVTVAYTWYGPDGDSVRSVVTGEAMDSGDKASSKAQSVAFRTAMIQTLCLPTDEPDPDSETYVRAERPQEFPPAKAAADAARAKVLAVCKENGIAPEIALARFAEKHGGDLRHSEDAAAIEALASYLATEYPDPALELGVGDHR